MSDPLPEHELIIIGGGVAGLTAGIYSVRSRIDTLLIERAFPGGLAFSTHLIENYPGFPGGISGPELTGKFEAQGRELGLKIENMDVSSINPADDGYVLTTSAGALKAKSIIIATGVTPRQLGIPGETELFTKGVSYCATCDGPLFRDREVAVLGGGDSAVQEAIYLSRLCSKVHLIHRRDTLRATHIIQERAEEKHNLEFHLSNIPEAIEGKERVEGVRVRDLKTGESKLLRVDAVFVYVGYNPHTEFLGDLIELDDGYIITDDDMSTSREGIFAAGDVRKKPLRQISTAVSDGAVAATSAGQYLENIESSVKTEIDENKKLMLRLKRIEGQIRGIQRLLRQGYDCKGVLQQISAARAALFRAGIHSAVANFRRCAYDGKGATTDFHEDIEHFLETLEKFS